MVFKVGGQTFELGPEDYLEKESNINGRCFAKVNFGYGYELPVTMLRDKCLMLNFKTKEIGLADKITKGSGLMNKIKQKKEVDF
jgi:hypothetical protein